jgi:MFS-type transporter involved in bile tolerance (Atg22 family)
MVGCGASIVSGTIFLFLFPRLNITLRQWTWAAYMLITLLSVWCLLGISDNIPIGFKHRVEFYLFQIFQNMAGSVLLPVFRVLFSEVFPKGSEIQYFGFQMVVSDLECLLWT